MIGYFHIDITEMRTKEGKRQMYVAIDRANKFAYAKLYERKTSRVAVEFLRELLKIAPYKIHTILTDNGGQFTSFNTKGEVVY
ncbi:MAG: DDE-type integrase/transposase/recombinase [Oligoflexia bacterium]|nr:DDE-type integrase/transposase/recombinase [Oligoflexia bacterium]